MDIIQIVILGIIASTILLVVRQQQSELALAIALAVSVSILAVALPALKTVVATFSDIASESGVGPLYFGIILKVLAVSYITDLGASICRDAEENLIASRVEMAGKILILLCSIPIIQGVVELIRTLLP